MFIPRPTVRLSYAAGIFQINNYWSAHSTSLSSLSVSASILRKTSARLKHCLHTRVGLAYCFVLWSDVCTTWSLFCSEAVACVQTFFLLNAAVHFFLDISFLWLIACCLVLLWSDVSPAATECMTSSAFSSESAGLHYFLDVCFLWLFARCLVFLDVSFLAIFFQKCILVWWAGYYRWSCWFSLVCSRYCHSFW